MDIYPRARIGQYIQHFHPEHYGPNATTLLKAHGEDGAIIVRWIPGEKPPSVEEVLNWTPPQPAPWAILRGQLDALEAQRQEGIRELRAMVAGALLLNGWSLEQAMLAWRKFYEDHGPAISAYIDGAAPKFAEDVAADKRAWLGLFASQGVTIRDAIIEAVS
jgi:hypothetical protein